MIDSSAERRKRANITSNEVMSAELEECDAVSTEPDRLRMYEVRAEAQDIELVPIAV